MSTQSGLGVMIIYIILVMIGSYFAARLIAGELRKERRNYLVLVEPSTIQTFQESSSVGQHSLLTADHQQLNNEIDFAEARSQKWEQILAEKNIEILNLIQINKTQRNQITEFDKFKALLERQVFESRDMNRNFKKDFDSILEQNLQSKKIADKFQAELNYKNQLLNQAEIKINELKNRIPTIVPDSSFPIQGPAITEVSDLSEFSFDQLDWRKKIAD